MPLFAALIVLFYFFTMSLGAAAARRARQYRWSVSADRLRALYEELTARALVECR